MFRAFQERRPWAAALIGAVFGPMIGMMYLGQGRKTLGYVAVYVAVVVVVTFLALPSDTGGLGFDFSVVQWVSRIAFVGVGGVHCYLVSRTLEQGVVKAWFARWYWILLLGVLAPLLMASMFRSLLWEPFSARSTSMEPTLHQKGMFFVNKVAYGYSSASFGFNPETGSGRVWGELPEHGDIVVFKAQGGIDFVKRVVGLPGDELQVRAGVLHINGRPVIRERVGTMDIPLRGAVNHFNQYTETLPNGRSYAILEESDDSPLDNTRKYVVPDNHVFVLGDNRDWSRDSRFPDFGYVPMENLVGRVSR